MNSENIKQFQKPRIIQAFVNGFNTTTNHIYLIILPVLLDLFIWFGPRISLQKVLSPVITSMQSMPELNTPEISGTLGTYFTALQEFLRDFNLTSLLRTIPVGVPSLVSGLAATQNPLGIPITLELASLSQFLLAFLMVSLVGLILASIYYQKAGASVVKDLKKRTWHDYLRFTLQIILIPIVITIILLIVFIPFSFLITFLTMITPLLGQVTTFIGIIMLIWVFIPLVFTPHSIFVFKQNLITSMLTSISIVRYTLPGSALFLLAALLLSEGMGILWRVPPANSWMLLVGILGNAFISTAILASTFHYFLEAAQYAQSVINQNIKRQEVIS